MNAPDKSKFLQLCLDDFSRRGEADARFLYDNRLVLPEAIRQQFEGTEDKSILERLYVEFIQNKFRYLTLLAQDEKHADDNMYKHLGKDEYNIYLHVLARLRKDRYREASMYLYRIGQLLHEEVHKLWYNHLDEFGEWSRHWENIVEQLLMGPASKLLQELCFKFTESAKKILSSSRVTEVVKKWVTEQIAEILSLPDYGDLSNEALQKTLEKRLRQAIESECYPLSAGVVEKVKNEITSTFGSMICQGERLRWNYVSALLFSLKEEFTCELSDCLLYNQDESKLILIRTTVDPVSAIQKYPLADPNTLYELLKNREAYRKAEGITGSILLLSNSDSYSYTGSDKLICDPRISEKHLSMYEDIYSDSLKAGSGKIRNFLALPLLKEGKIEATIRAVNRLNDVDELDPDGWPLFQKLQLCTIIMWFNTVWWPIINSYKIEEVGHWWDIMDEWRNLIRSLVKELDGWNEYEIQISKILKEMQRISQRQVETQRYGCRIVFGTEQDCRRLVNGRSARQSQDEGITPRLEEIASWCKKYKKEIFVFNQNCLLVDIIDTEPMELKELTRDNRLIAFLVEPTQRSARIFSQGRLRAEYLLLPRKGDWQLRLFENSLNMLLKAAPCCERAIMERLWEVCWYVSYASQRGKMILLGENLDNTCVFNGGDPASPVDVNSKEFLGYALEEEGAVCVSTKGRVIERVRSIVNPRGKAELGQGIEEKLGRDEMGSKHWAGARISVACPDGLVFVISENRGITVFQNGKDILWSY